MQLICGQDIDDSDFPCPTLEPLLALITDDMIAGWGMLDNTDFSGNGNDFTFNGEFNSVGAILANDADHVIQTPVLETDEMTLIYCCNVAAVPDVLSSLIGNINIGPPGPYNGFREYLNVTGQGFLSASAANGSLAALQHTFAGAWTVKTLRMSQTNLDVIIHAGTVSTRTIAGRAIGTHPICMNGMPAGSPSAVIGGLTGTLGPVLLYNGIYDAAKCVELMDAVADIMLTDRGTPVP